MSAIQICQQPQTFALNCDAIRLAEQFCSCPQAQNFLSSISFSPPIYLTFANHQHLHLRQCVDSATGALRKITIEIPSHAMGTKRALSSLLLEFFSIKKQPELQSIFQRAKEGRVGMEAFVSEIEKSEEAGAPGHNDLMKKCEKQWKEITTLPLFDPEVSHWIHEFECHLDANRVIWMDRFKNAYCKNFPEDHSSCQRKKQDLCNVDVMEKFSKKKHEQCYAKRICGKYPTLSEKVRNYPSFQALTRQYCPKLHSTSKRKGYEHLARRDCPQIFYPLVNAPCK